MHQRTNTYAAAWEQAERDLRHRIRAIHDLGVELDRAGQHLNWRGGSAGRFHARAAVLHRDLHQHNDSLRFLLSLVQQAAEVKIPAHAGKGAAA